MRVGLLPVDSLIPNLALMRLSAWHKAQGDEVEIAFPLAADTYGRVYRSKQFDYTVDDMVPWPCEVVSGGTGYDLTTLLTPEQDTIYPDYPILSCDHALGRLTRGCIRRCPWCVVWRQDGKVRQVAELEDFWRGQDRIRLLDDNLTALPDLFIKTCAEISARKAQVKFESLDIRLMDEDMARALAGVRRWMQESGCTRGAVHFAWDTPADEPAVRRGIEALKAGGFPIWAATFYVLIGFNTTPEEDLHRAMVLKSLGADPFVMPFDKTDPYQRRFARYVNHKAIFKTVAWEEYDR